MFSRRQGIRLASIAAAAAVAMSLTACGDDDDSNDSSPGATPDGAGKAITVWIMEGTNPDPTEFFDQVKADFTEQTGAEVDIQFVPWADAHGKFVNAVAGEETPDVAEVGTTWTPEFADAGILADLTDRAAGSAVGDDLVDALVTAGEIDGKLYGMPWYAGVRSIVYRTDVFEELELDVPTNWTELVEVAETIKAEKPDMIPFPVVGKSQYGLWPFVWGSDGEIAVQEGDQWVSQLDSEQSRAGVEFYTGLATEHELSSPQASTWNELDVREQFVAGKVAMMISGSWTPGAIVEGNADLDGNLGAFPIPGKDGGLAPSFLGGSHLSVFEGSDEQELAWAFVELMTNAQNMATWAEQSGFFPGLKSLLNESTASDDPLVAPFAQQMLEAGNTVPVAPTWGKVEAAETVPSMLLAILSGDKSVEDATAAAASEMTDLLTE